MSDSTIPKLDESEFEVRFSKEKNRCLYTTKFIKKDDVVIEYVGEIVTTTSEMKKREISYAKNNLGCYILEFSFKGKKAYIDATEETIHKARLMNHSNDANLMPFKRIINDRPQIFFKAKVDINPNTELVWDYGDRRRAVVENNPWLSKAKRLKITSQIKSIHPRCSEGELK